MTEPASAPEPTCAHTNAYRHSRGEQMNYRYCPDCKRAVMDPETAAPEPQPSVAEPPEHIFEPVREWFTAADSELKVCPFCYTSALEGEAQCTRCHAEPAEPGSRGLYRNRPAAGPIADLLRRWLAFAGDPYDDPNLLALINETRAAASAQPAAGSAAMRAAINAACAIIEMGDQRLLARDGDAYGPPDLTLAEWRKLYVTLDKARKDSRAQPAAGSVSELQAVARTAERWGYVVVHRSEWTRILHQRLPEGNIVQPAAGSDALREACPWTPDDDGVYHTGCGNAFFFDTGTADENRAHFCQYCGKPLSAQTPDTRRPETAHD
jgi:hypothetical protein